MKVIISFFVVLLILTPCFASDESISITVKPSTGLSGTTSFNIHQDGTLTVLRYESPTKISEKSVDLESKKIKEIGSLAHDVLKEVLSTDDFSTWPEQKATFSVAITREKVTKSISTRRFSKKVSKLINLLKEYGVAP